MAKRFRYSFARKKESVKGKWSVGLAACSFLLFFAAVFASFLLDERKGFIAGGICLFAFLLSVYGFLIGVTGFSDETCTHRTNIIGSIANGIFMMAWLGFYLIGV